MSSSTLWWLFLTPLLILLLLFSRYIVSDSLQPYEMWPTGLLCPWDFPGKNTGAGCHFRGSWGNLPDSGIKPTSSALQADSLPLSHLGSSILLNTIQLLGFRHCVALEGIQRWLPQKSSCLHKETPPLMFIPTHQGNKVGQQMFCVFASGMDLMDFRKQGSGCYNLRW